MSTINQLNAVDTPSGSDLLVIYSQQNGDSRKISLSNFLVWIQDNIVLSSSSAFPEYITQYSAPSATGFTVTLTDTQTNGWLILTPTAGFAAGTIKLPLASNTLDKQEAIVNCTQAVTTLTIDGNGATAVTGAPTTLAANANFRLKYDKATSSWYRIG